MADFSNFQRGQPISASAFRALQAQVNRSRPALGGATTMSGVGGTATVFDDPGWFLAKITAVTGTGATATYSGVEMAVEAHVGDLIERGSPRRFDKDTNPGRCVLASSTLAVEDVCLARRAVGSPNEWELVPVGAGGDDFWAALVTKTGSTCPSYTFRRVTPTGTACGWTVDDAVASPEGPLYEVNACDLPINDPVTDDPDQFIVVRARPGPGAFFVFEEASRWEFVKTTSSTPDAITGYFPGVILTFSTGGSPVDAEAIWIWDLNATP